MDYPAERVRHGRRTPDLPAEQGEPDKENGPVDCCPGERPSQEGSGRYPSEAGKAKRRGGAQQGLFQHLPRLGPRCLEILAVSIAKIKDRDQILKVLPLYRLARPLQVSFLFDSRDKQYK